MKPVTRPYKGCQSARSYGSAPLEVPPRGIDRGIADGKGLGQGQLLQMKKSCVQMKSEMTHIPSSGN